MVILSPASKTEGDVTNSLPSHDASGVVRLRALLLRSLALGGLAGAAHVAFASRKFYLKGTFAWASRDLIWMSPVANAGLLAAVSVVLWGAGRAASGRIREGSLEGVLAGLAALAVLLLLGGLHLGATFVFAIGLGVQHARMVNRGSRLVRLSTGVGVVLFVALVAGGLVERATRDVRAHTMATSTPPAGAPNVIVIIWDTVRAMSLGLYGAPRPTTPELERLAARATTFDWAMAPAPWTLPSHCSMFTGLQPGEHTCRWDVPLRGAPTTLALELARRGWRTGAFVANHYYTTHETGLQLGFGHYEDLQVTPKQVLLSSTLMQTAPARDLLTGDTFAERTRSIRRFDVRGDPKPLVDRKLAAGATDDFLDWQAREPGSRSSRSSTCSTRTILSTRRRHGTPPSRRRLRASRSTKGASATWITSSVASSASSRRVACSTTPSSSSPRTTARRSGSTG